MVQKKRGGNRPDMIRLKDLLELNEMTYNDGADEKHQRRIDQPVTLFNEFELPRYVFPENSSKETLEELKYLVRQKGNHKEIKEYDKVRGSFKKKHKELGLEFDKYEAKDLLDQSAKYIMELKYKYNRPRPYQIAEFYGLNVEKFNLDSMNTPSYPSGHATQGYLLGMIYSERYPEHRKEFMKLGEDIAESRIKARAHFPSDKKAGIELAEKLFENRK